MCFPGGEVIVQVEAVDANLVHQAQLSGYQDKINLVLFPEL